MDNRCNLILRRTVHRALSLKCSVQQNKRTKEEIEKKEANEKGKRKEKKKKKEK